MPYVFPDWLSCDALMIQKYVSDEFNGMLEFPYVVSLWPGVV